MILQVFRQRLEQEHGASVIVTAPTVPCRIMLPGGETVELQNPAEFPTNTKIAAGGCACISFACLQGAASPPSTSKLRQAGPELCRVCVQGVVRCRAVQLRNPKLMCR